MEKTDLPHENDNLFAYKNNSGISDPYEIGTYIVGNSFPVMTTNSNYLGSRAALQLAAGLNASDSPAVMLRGNQNAAADDAHAAKLFTNFKGGQIIRTKEPIFTTTYHNTVIMTDASTAGPKVSLEKHMTNSIPALRNYKEYIHETDEDVIARLRGHHIYRPSVPGGNTYSARGLEASTGKQHGSGVSGYAPCATGGGYGCNPMRPGSNSAQAIFSKN